MKNKMTSIEAANILVSKLNTYQDDFGSQIFRAKVWQSGEHTRVYTGHRGEYLNICGGTIEKSKLNMTWGQIIDEICSSKQTQKKKFNRT